MAWIRFASYVLVLCLGLWAGSGLTARGYEKRLVGISTAIADSYKSVIADAGKKLAAERTRYAAAEAHRAQQRAAAAEVISEVISDGDRSCEWRPEHRLRIERIYSAYGYDPRSPDRVPDEVQGATEHEAAE